MEKSALLPLEACSFCPVNAKKGPFFLLLVCLGPARVKTYVEPGFRGFYCSPFAPVVAVVPPIIYVEIFCALKVRYVFHVCFFYLLHRGSLEVLFVFLLELAFTVAFASAVPPRGSKGLAHLFWPVPLCHASLGVKVVEKFCGWVQSFAPAVVFSSRKRQSSVVPDLATTPTWFPGPASETVGFFREVARFASRTRPIFFYHGE
mmetsp:Transcript_2331/g.3878  ORF Transcript_2331/g.3878 Transcript_2331/m.3878 type:complete len:204 (-) Transcript_2331:368-979(-)